MARGAWRVARGAWRVARGAWLKPAPPVTIIRKNDDVKIKVRGSGSFLGLGREERSTGFPACDSIAHTQAGKPVLLSIFNFQLTLTTLAASPRVGLPRCAGRGRRLARAAAPMDKNTTGRKDNA